MNSKNLSSKLVRLLAILALVMPLVMGTVSPASATVNNTVVAWGSNLEGQGTVPDGLGDINAIAAGGFHSLALKADGTVVAWGNNSYGQRNVPDGLTGVAAIAATGNHNLALKADGTVVAWGDNSDGQANVPAGLSGVTAIAAGNFHSLALKSDGTLAAWGKNDFGQISVPDGLTGVTAIAASVNNSLALKADGTVVAWGDNYHGQISVPAGLSGVTAIAAGRYHSLALKADGTVVAWGWDGYDQISVPAGLRGVAAIAAGWYHSLALKADGTVVAWGWDIGGQISVPAGLSGVTGIAGGFGHSLALVSSPTDLTITQIADQKAVSAGDPVGFTITITNNSAVIASSVTLLDFLPVLNELNWSISGTDAAFCTITEGNVSCDFGNMPPGAVKTIRLTSPTYHEAYRSSCPTITSDAYVRANNQPGGKRASAFTWVLCPDIIMTVGSNDWGPTIAGDPISYMVVVTNMGQGIARDVDAGAELPNKPGLSWSITSVTPPSAAGNCSLDTFGLWCFFDELAPGQDVIITGSSPTTSRSCGEHLFYGAVTISNGAYFKAKPWNYIISCTVGNTVQPGEAATLTLPDSRGQTDFPANLVSETTTFTYTEQNAPSQDLGSNAYAGLSFTLDATDTAGNPVTSFPASYTIQLTYQDSDWQSTGIADESLLNLAYWDTVNGQWVNVLPCEGCSLDTEQNQLVAALNHLTEFALLVPTDTTPPATSATLSPQASASGWHAGPVTVTLTALDSESGILNTEYNLNGAGWTTYNAPFAVSSESTSSTVHNTVQYRSMDEAGNVEETKSLTIQMDTTAPTVGASVPLSGNAVQGGIKFGVNLADALSGPASATLSIREADGASGKQTGHENLAAVYNSTSGTWELAQPFDTTQLPDGSYVLVATGKDVAGNEKTEIIAFSVLNNTAPTANAGGPYLGAVNTAISFDGSLSSDPESDLLAYAWDFGDGATGTGATPDHTYTASGLYNVCLAVNDGALNSAQACTLAVVYDPSEGFVTGGGWINSPAGAYIPDPSLAGRADFGFVSKYHKGAAVPSGQTEFQFEAGSFSFESEAYDWLVVAGAKAQFKGSGAVNGVSGYSFLLTLTDGQINGGGGVDKFRIKIWDVNGVVYDNMIGYPEDMDGANPQAIGGGSIVIHNK